MKNALWKDIFRDIKKSKGRFISIVSIIALGVMLFAGVKIAPINMKKTADKYYDKYNLMDLRVVSTLGLTSDDVKDIKKIDGVLGVEESNTIDAISKVDSEEFVIKIHGMQSDNLNKDNEDYINRLKLVEGRLPEKSAECVVARENFKSLNLNVGDKIELKSGTDSEITDALVTKEYEIVGMVETPYYLTDSIGTTNIGSGNIETFMFVKQSDFKSDVYTDIYVTVKEAKELNSYKDEYFNVVDKVKNSIEDISNAITNRRYNEIKDTANEELLKGKQEYEDKKKEVENQLNDAKNQIETSKIQLADAEKEIKGKELELKNTITSAESKLKAGEEELLKKEKQYNEGLEAFNSAKALAEEGFKKAEEEINNSENELNSLISRKSYIEESLKNDSLTEEEREKLQEELNTLIPIINGSTELLNTAKSELKIKKEEIASKEQGLKIAKEQIEKAKRGINSSKEELRFGRSEAQTQISKAKEEVKKGKEKLAEGEAEYEKNKVLADEELLKAEENIKDVENEIAKIEKPSLYVLDRKSHYSYVDYENSANSIDKLSNVFPAFFFVVAALVCLTTMTRMVDEQRINIGTMKALGYGKGSIAKKFIVYALLASLIGSIIGLTIGFTGLPLVIFNAYKIMYILPEMTFVISIPLALVISVVSIGLTTLVTYNACRIELIETPAILMRPKAPKEGKRILLERIPFIWNRFNFIAKVTIRNIFRYKKRFLMTIIGIAGSTALLLSGFGIKDSIKTVVSKQFGDLTKYEITVNLDKNIESVEKSNVENYLNGEKSIENYLFIRSENSKVSANDVENEVGLITTSDKEKFSEFNYFQDRRTEKQIDLPSDGVAITEKLAKVLKVKVGDEITITNGNDVYSTAKVGAIVENYINHYIYMEASYYETVFNRKAELNAAFIISNSEANLDELSNNLIELDGVSGVVNNSGIKDSFNDTIQSLDFVVLVMILAAGALSFIVLYNLTNVNISERIREIATIKVLGFYDKEVSAYIFRENILLTTIGLGCGLLLGSLFHKFIIVTVEMEYIMFGRSIDIKSFMIASVLTIIFSLLVNLAMYYKLKNVEMVESLKSVD